MSDLSVLTVNCDYNAKKGFCEVSSLWEESEKAKKCSSWHVFYFPIAAELMKLIVYFSEKFWSEESAGMSIVEEVPCTAQASEVSAVPV